MADTSDRSMADMAKTEGPWGVVPRWCLQPDTLRDGKDGDGKRSASPSAADGEDESGLELSLGLSLGGAASKVRAKNAVKEMGVEKIPEDGSTSAPNLKDHKKHARVVCDAGLTRAQSFWQGFSVTRDMPQEESSSRVTSGTAHIRERQLLSSDSSHSILTSLSLPTAASVRSEALHRHESASGDECKATLTHQMWHSLQEKACHGEQSKHNFKEESPLFKDLSLSSQQSASWGRFGQSGVAMQLLDSFKESADSGRVPNQPNALMNSGSGNNSLHSSGSGVSASGREGTPPNASRKETSPPDENAKAVAEQQQRHAQDALEQQRKREMHAQRRQEARKKRKMLIEEQKQQKKSKKEDDRSTMVKQPTRPNTPGGSKAAAVVPPRDGIKDAPSPPDSQDAVNTAPRRTGMARGGSSPEKNVLDQHEEGKQLVEIRRALQREKDRAVKSWDEKDGDARLDDTERRVLISEASRPLLKHAKPEPGPAQEDVSSPSDGAWAQRAAFEMQKNMHQSQVVAPSMDSKGETKDGAKGIPDLNGSSKKRERALDTSEREKVKLAEAGDRSLEGRANGADNKVGVEAGMRANPNPSMVPPGAYAQGSSSFPPMHVPFPYHINAGGMYPLPYPFPYLMPFSSSSDAAVLGKERPPMDPSAYQMPPNFSQFPCPVDVASTWAPVLRPQPTPPHSPPRSLARSSSGTGEDETRVSQGIKSTENKNVRNASPAREMLPGVGGILLRASSLGSVQGQSGAFARLRPSPSLPPTPQFGPVRGRPDSNGEPFLFRESSLTGNTAFASLVAAVEASQGLSAAVASVSNTSLKGAHIQRSVSGVKVESAPVTSPEAQEDVGGGSRSVIRPNETHEADCGTKSVASQEEEDKSQSGNGWHQGSTHHVTTGSESLAGPEASSLKPGIAAGQMFGGCGSSPDLPWVTCTGAGPNGKAICGVLYRFHKGHVRIVCACHGRHMTPGEFVQHAGSLDLSNPEKSIVVGPFTLASQAAASAQA